MIHHLLSSKTPPPDVLNTLWGSCDSMMIIDAHRNVVAINPALEQLVGQRSHEWIGQVKCGKLFGCKNTQGKSLLATPQQCPGLCCIKDQRPNPGTEFVIQNRHGKDIYVHASYTPITLHNGPGALVILRDISNKHEHEAALEKRAAHDPLTELLNRTGLIRLGTQELMRAKEYDYTVAICMLDIDHFKQHNDAYGHIAGDEVLKAIANLLMQDRRTTDIVSRYGGDEFVLILPETKSKTARVVLERIRKAIEAHDIVLPFGKAPDHTVKATISLGMAMYPEEGDALLALLEKADQKLYQAKTQGRNQLVYT